MNTKTFAINHRKELAVEGWPWPDHYVQNTNTAATTRRVASGAFAVAMTAADLNRDGKPNLVIANFVHVFAPPNVDVAFHK
jgi:hypothetical protein